MKYRVICREDSPAEGEKGKYVLVSKEFDDQEAAVKYASEISPSREPRVLLDVTEMTVAPPSILDDLPITQRVGSHRR